MFTLQLLLLAAMVGGVWILRDRSRRARALNWLAEVVFNRRPLNEPRLVRGAVRAAWGSARRTMSGRILANDVVVELAFDEYQQLKDIESHLAADVADALVRETDGFAVLTGRPRVRLRVNPMLVVGQVRFRARVASDPQSDAWPDGAPAEAAASNLYVSPVPQAEAGRGAATTPDVSFTASRTHRMIRLIVKVAGQPPRIELLDEGCRTVGRDPDCDLRVDHPTVSGRHAELDITRDGLALRDLGSLNGVFVTTRGYGGSPLRDGSIIRLSSVVTLTVVEGQSGRKAA